MLSQTEIILEGLNKLEQDSEYFNYVLRYSILTFNAEVENKIKDIIKENVNKIVNKLGIYKFCKLKLKNLSFSDIRYLFEQLGIKMNDLNASDIQLYSTIISDRDKIAHDPNAIISTSKNDLKNVIKIAEKIITEFKEGINKL